jgi:hypothetical protein
MLDVWGPSWEAKLLSYGANGNKGNVSMIELFNPAAKCRRKLFPGKFTSMYKRLSLTVLNVKLSAVLNESILLQQFPNRKFLREAGLQGLSTSWPCA